MKSKFSQNDPVLIIKDLSVVIIILDKHTRVWLQLIQSDVLCKWFLDASITFHVVISHSGCRGSQESDRRRWGQVKHKFSLPCRRPPIKKEYVAKLSGEEERWFYDCANLERYDCLAGEHTQQFVHRFCRYPTWKRREKGGGHVIMHWLW